jgi:hypothetical protein
MKCPIENCNGRLILIDRQDNPNVYKCLECEKLLVIYEISSGSLVWNPFS